MSIPKESNILTQNINIDIFTVMRTSNLTMDEMSTRMNTEKKQICPKRENVK
jgi:hypothetical protein